MSARPAAEHPYDGIDLAFLLLSAMVPQLAPLALLQYAARRSRLVVGGLLQLAAQTRGEPALRRFAARPAVQALLPGAAELAGPKAAGETPGTLTLDALADADNILVVGPKGSGKTTLLRALLAQRTGSHCALDPHNHPGKWPCSVVGGGLDFDAIDTYLQAVDGRLTGRYQAMNRGVVEHPRLSLVADEWRAIAHALPDARRAGVLRPGAARTMLKLITQGRKVRLCFIGAGHADTVEALGIAGEGDLRTCFDWIIYLGALAVRRLPEARAQERPAVAYSPERDEYILLALPPVRERPAARVTPVRERSSARYAGPHEHELSSERGDELLTRLLNDVREQPNGANRRSARLNAEREGDERSRTAAFAAETWPLHGANANVHGAPTLALGNADCFPAEAEELDEDALAPTADELRRLARAVTLRAAGRSKQESIEEAFEVRKGGSPRWQRAYALFEAATR